METEQKEMMCKYKKIICKIFGEQIRVIGESSAIGPMGQFQIRFFYEPTKNLCYTGCRPRGIYV